MSENLGFILKVLIASAIISFIIKYVLPELDIPVNSGIAIVIVLFPALATALVLAWQAQQSHR